MDDEAKLIVELLDRSGSSGAAATNPAQPGAADVPGSTLAADFQKKVTEQGAGASAGSGSAPAPPPSATVPSLPPAGNPVSGNEGITPAATVTPTGDPLLSTVRGIVQADPKATSDEIQKALGITAERASELINAARGATTQTSTPSGPPAPPASTPPAPAPSGEPDKTLERFAQQVRDLVMTDEERYNRQIDRLKEARDSGLLETEDYQRAVKREQDHYLSILNREQERRLKPPPPPEQEVEAPPLPPMVEPIGADEAAQAASRIFDATGRPLLGGFGGPVGKALANLGSSTISALPQLLPEGASAGAMAALLPAAGPAVAIAGTALAGAGLVAAGVAATVNEAERARSQISNISPQVARAQAESDVNQVMANMRTSQTLGDEVSRYIRQSSRLSTELQQARDTLSEPLIRSLNETLSSLASAIEGFNKLTETVPGLKDGIQNQIQMLLDLGSGGILPGLRNLNKFLEDSKTEKASPFTWFMDQPFLTPPPPFDGEGKGVVVRDETKFGEPLPGLTL